jgi:hypothetical protein
MTISKTEIEETWHHVFRISRCLLAAKRTSASSFSKDIFEPIWITPRSNQFPTDKIPESSKEKQKL